MTSPRTAPRSNRLAALTALALLAGCQRFVPEDKTDAPFKRLQEIAKASSSDSLTRKPKKDQTPEPPPPQEPSRPKADEPVVLFRPRGEQLSHGVQEALRNLDPTAAGWVSEAMAEMASHELSEFLKLVVEPKSHGRLGWYLTEDFEGTTSLVPEPVETRFDDGTYRVRGAETMPTELRPLGEVPQAFGELTSRFDSAYLARIYGKSKIFTTEIDPLYPKRFQTRALVTLWGKTPDGAQCQVNAEWDLTWAMSRQGRTEAVRIRRIELASYEEVLLPKRLFAEITNHVLGGVPSYAEEFLLGCGEYHFRTDVMYGNSFAGQLGIAVGDADGDGLDDLFVPQQGGLPNRLLVRRADGTVVDRSAEAKLDLLDETTCALFVDIDGDGDQDLVLGRGNGILFALNDGKGTFEYQRRVLAAGTDEITSLTAADWDLDGDLDLYACMYGTQGPLGTIPVPYLDAANGPPNAAWRNDGEGRWTNATEELGLDDNDAKFSFAAVWEDFDLDGDPDLYVVNDFGTNNLYRNDDGHFSDVAREAGASDPGAGMGVTVADVNLDGWPDIYVTNMWSSAGRRIVPQEQRFRNGGDVELRGDFLRHARGNSLLLNRGDGTFEDVTETSGAMNGGWAWGSIALDLNNDGLADLYSPNGFISGTVQDDL